MNRLRSSEWLPGTTKTHPVLRRSNVSVGARTMCSKRAMHCEEQRIATGRGPARCRMSSATIQSHGKVGMRGLVTSHLYWTSVVTTPNQRSLSSQEPTAGHTAEISRWGGVQPPWKHLDMAPTSTAQGTLRKRRQKDHQSQKARQSAVKQSLLEMAELNKVISLDMLTRKGHLTGSHP